jgi:hypothetical protein
MRVSAAIKRRGEAAALWRELLRRVAGKDRT